MDILGIGPLELVLILVIALLVFGPDKLPEIGAKLGKGVRELRQLSREISQGVNTITDPVDELRKPFDEASSITKQITETADSLRNPGQVLQNALNQQLRTTDDKPAAQDSTAAGEPVEENTIAPPALPALVEPVASLSAASSVADGQQEAPNSPASVSQPVEPVVPVDPSAALSAQDVAGDPADGEKGQTVNDAPAADSPTSASER